MNIEYINLFLYILQICIISFWIYIWYKNYKELMRKNNIEEHPYLKITKESNWDIYLKNCWKTPIIIYDIQYKVGKGILSLFIESLNEIMPNESEKIKVNIVDEIKSNKGNRGKTIQISVEYWNHILTKTKTLTIHNEYIEITEK